MRKQYIDEVKRLIKKETKENKNCLKKRMEMEALSNEKDLRK